MGSIRRKLQQIGLQDTAQVQQRKSRQARRATVKRKKRRGLEVAKAKEYNHAESKRKKGKSLRLRQDQAVEYYIQGWSYLEIGKRMGVSTSYAGVLVQKGMERFQSSLGLAVKDWQNKQLRQIHALYGKHIKHAKKSVHSAEFCLKCIQAEAEIVGTKKVVNVFVPPPAELEYDLSTLTVEQLVQLRALAALARPQGNTAPELPRLAPPDTSPDADGDVVDGEFTEVDDDNDDEGDDEEGNTTSE